VDCVLWCVVVMQCVDIMIMHTCDVFFFPPGSLLSFDAVCCSVLRCVVVCCSVLRRVKWVDTVCIGDGDVFWIVCCGVLHL